MDKNQLSMVGFALLLAACVAAWFAFR